VTLRHRAVHPAEHREQTSVTTCSVVVLTNALREPVCIHWYCQIEAQFRPCG
jgi:hypothetical protein